MLRSLPLSSYCPSRILQQLAKVFGIDVAVKIVLYKALLGIGVDDGSIFIYIICRRIGIPSPRFGRKRRVFKEA